MPFIPSEGSLGEPHISIFPPHFLDQRRDCVQSSSLVLKYIGKRLCPPPGGSEVKFLTVNLTFKPIHLIEKTMSYGLTNWLQISSLMCIISS